MGADGIGKASRPGSAGGQPGFVRAAALVAIVLGGLASVALTLYAGRNNPARFLIVLFALWVVSPFVALAFGYILSRSWSALTRSALYGVALLVTLASLALYAFGALRPAGPRTTALFLLFPPACWLLIVLVLGIAALLSRARSSPG